MSETQRAISVDDLTRIKALEDPQLSPDGQWIVYVVAHSQRDKKGYDRQLFMIASDGSGAPIQLTHHGKNMSPRWSPDGDRLAFVSTRAERPQIHILPMTAPGEARQLTSHAQGASSPAWSPDGKHIAYLSRSNETERQQEDDQDRSADDSAEQPQDALASKHRQERQEHDEHDEQARWDPRPIERIPYRQGTAFMDDRHAQIYVVATATDLEGDDAKPRRLTNTAADYSPPTWSKSGNTLITSRAWDTQADEAWLYSNIYLIDVESGLERRIKDDDFAYYAPRPSYDGDWLATIRTPRGKTDQMSRLCLLHLVGEHEMIDLNLKLDVDVMDYDWTADGQLTVLTAQKGWVTVHRVDPLNEAFTPILQEQQVITGFHLKDDGAFAFVSRTSEGLPELFYSHDDQTQQLTHINQAFTDEVIIQPTHEFWFKNGEGQTIQGWYVLPPDYQEGELYPLALNIHGGPHVMWSPATPAMWHEWQCHAAAGYVVFYCNPRGSAGYGQDYLSAIRSNWGGVTMIDIMAGVDALIEKGLVDADRMAITGGSFGGYMTAWIIGHTERFKAAVPQRGVYNISSFYGTSDIPILMRSEFESEPWEDREKYWQQSPLAYAHQIETPTLIIHSEQDYRVPIEQAEQLFAWIRRATDTPVKLLRYAREGHELSRSGEPQHRISRLQEMIAWFDRYCQPEKEQSAPSTDTSDD